MRFFFFYLKNPLLTAWGAEPRVGLHALLFSRFHPRIPEKTSNTVKRRRVQHESMSELGLLLKPGGRESCRCFFPTSE